MMKFRTLTTSSGLVSGPTKSSPSNKVEHVHMNRFVAGLDFVGLKTEPLEVVEVRDFIFEI